jgi:predicted dehydrogenase
MSKIEGAQLTAVADVNAETAAKVAEETGAKAFPSAEAMIESGEVEAIVIATPHFFHPPVAEFAAKHKVHVLSEKPVAVTVSAADKMIAACEEAGVFLGVVFQQRTDPVRQKMKQIIDDGTLGTVHRISMSAPWYRPQAYYDSGAWRGTWKGEGGGILMNQAPHSLDQFVWLGGFPKSVHAIAHARLHNIEVENTGLAIFDYGNGQVGWFYASTAEVPTPERVEVAGDHGLLVLEGNSLRFFELEESIPQHLATFPKMFGEPKGQWRDIEVPEGHGSHTEVVRAFAQAIRANDPSLMVANGRDGRDALELANGILLAGYTHREVALPIDREQFDNMLSKLQAGESPESFRSQ